MDYHSIGFRECAAEVARYLVTVEGMDIQDPLRLRLMSHLQCFAAQRELATKQASTAWNYNSYSGIHDYPTTNTYDVSIANLIFYFKLRRALQLKTSDLVLDVVVPTSPTNCPSPCAIHSTDNNGTLNSHLWQQTLDGAAAAR